MAGLKKLIVGIRPHRTHDADRAGSKGPSIWKRTSARLHKNDSVATLSIDPLSKDERLSASNRVMAGRQRVSAEEYFSMEYERKRVQLGSSLQALALSTLRLEAQTQHQVTSLASPIDVTSDAQQHIEFKLSAPEIEAQITNTTKLLQGRLRQTGDYSLAGRLSEITDKVVAHNSPLRSSFLEYLQSELYEEGWKLTPTEHFSCLIAWLFHEIERLVLQDFSLERASDASSYKTATESSPRKETNPFRTVIEERKAWEAAYESMQDQSSYLDSPAGEAAADSSQPAIQGRDKNPYRKGKNRALPSMLDIDWSQVPEDDVQGFIESLTNPSSRADSGVDFGEGRPDDFTVTTNGKGKVKVVGHLRSSQDNEPAAPSALSYRKPVQTMENIMSLDSKRAELPVGLLDSSHCISHLADTMDDLRLDHERIAKQIAARQRECVVCGDEKPPLEFPARAVTEACDHSARTCSECLQAWMVSEFETKGTEGIKCPECTAVLGYTDVQRAASTETFVAYDKRCTLNVLSSLPEFAWCLSPTCGSGQLNIENANFMDCMSCGYKQCLRHRTPWHVGEKCNEYDYRTSGQKAKDEEKATEAMLDTVSKLCPGKRCGWRIEKSIGCDHMTCRKCRHEFCWQCLAPQKEIKRVGNTAHATTCKFHSNNLDVAWPFNMH